MDIFRILFIYLVYIQILVARVTCQTFNDTRTVHETILSFYANNDIPLTSVIPLEDQASAMSVFLTMHLYSVDGFDAVTGQIEISGSLYIEWIDETMAASIGNYVFKYNKEGKLVFILYVRLFISIKRRFGEILFQTVSQSDTFI